MRVTAERVFAYTALIVVFSYTYFLGALFVGGDQEHYRAVYDASSKNDLFSAYAHYRARIQSDEIGHFLVSWMAAQVIEKDLFNAFVNAVLAFFTVRLFVKWGAHPLIALAIAVFGYYHLAMYVSAERLKYASTFFVVGAFYYPRYRLSYLMLLASIVTHLQYVVMIAVVVFQRLSKAFISALLLLKVRVSDISLAIIALLLAFFLFILFFDHIVYKLAAYHRDFGSSEYLRVLLFFLGSIFYSNERLKVFSCFTVLFLAVGLVGGDRINLFGYFLFLYFAFPVRRGLNIGVILTLVYFGFGWVQYVFWVIDCGINRPC